MLLTFFTLAVFTFFCLLAFSMNLFMTKKIEGLVPLILFVLNFIALVYNGWKQSLILQTKPNRLLQISFFHRNLIYVYLKKDLGLYVGRLGYEFASMLVTFVCISYFSSQIYINPTSDAFLVSRGKKSRQSLYI